MFFNYSNCRLLINGTGLLATRAQIGEEASNSPVYVVSQKNTQSYVPENGIGGSLRFSYYLTGTDFVKSFIAEEQTVLSGNFGGLNFRSGYLKSYSVNGDPHAPVQANAEIVFFDELKGVFAPTLENAAPANVLNFADVTMSDPTNGSLGSISNIVGFSYNFSSDVQPVYVVGETVPRDVSFGPKEVNVEIQTDNLSGNLPVSGKNAGVTITFTHPQIPSLSESLSCSGFLFRRDISSSVGQFTKSTLQIRQNYVIDPPSISSFSPTTTGIGSTVSISGANLSTAISVIFNDALAATFTAIGNTGINAVVPPDAISGPITVNTQGGSAISSSNFTVVSSDITVTGIRPITGHVGQTVSVLGTNFNRISLVKFNDGQVANFSVANSGLIIATVPEATAWGTVTVISTLKEKTGTSTESFVPFPRVSGFNPPSGVTGTTISITGQGFSGVAGVYFNNISGAFTVLTNARISYTLPSGNTKGFVKVYGKSGVFGISNTEFLPLAEITGVLPLTGRTGVAAEILGNNFMPGIMYETTSNNFLVSFNGGTGSFARVNSIRLTGLVPETARSGVVSVYMADGATLHPSQINFYLINSFPEISFVYPKTGVTGSLVTVYGSNLLDITGFKFTGNNTNSNGANIAFNPAGDAVSAIVPTITGGLYSIVINTRYAGDVTGSNLFTVATNPYVSGFTPLSGAVGESILVSGSGLYPGSRLFINTTGFEAATSGFVGHTGMRFSVPLNPPTGGRLIVFNGYGYHTGSNAFICIATPSISGFSPTSGNYGDIISVSGSNLNNTTGMRVGSTTVATFSPIGTTGINMTIPVASSSDYIYILHRGAEVSSDSILSVTVGAIVINTFVPKLVVANDNLTISGSYLDTATYIKFSGLTGEVTVDTFTVTGTTGINVTIPNNLVDGKITILNPYYTTVSSETLEIGKLPAISLLDTTGVYRQRVRVSGQTLSAMSFYFSGATGDLVIADNTSYIGTTGASFTVPREIQTGPVTVSGSGIIYGVSNSQFLVIPTISGFTPQSGVNGTIVTITGINAVNVSAFVGISGSGYLFNLFDTTTTALDNSRITGFSDSRTGYTLITGLVSTTFEGTGKIFLVPTEFSAITGIGELTTNAFWGQLPSGISTDSYVTKSGPPIISSFTPTRGNSSTLITVIGLNLSSVTGMYVFSGTTQSSGIIYSQTASSLQFYPPVFAQSSGLLRAYSAYGTGISSQYFTYFVPPFISGFTPTRGLINTYLKITGSGLINVTGVQIGNENVDFVISLQNSSYVISGLVPDVTGVPRYAKIKVLSEAGTHESGWYLIYSNAEFLKYKATSSELLPMPTGTGVFTFAHGIGQVPDYGGVAMTCVVPEFGFISGEEAIINTTLTVGVQESYDETYLYFTRNASSQYFVISKTTCASQEITNSKWRLGAHAYGSYYRVPVPNAPTGVNTTVLSETGILVEWGVDDSYRDGFKIERKSGQYGVFSQIKDVGATVRSYTDTGVTENNDYYYKVRSYNNSL